MATKKCKKCKKEKPCVEFYAAKSNKDGLTGKCKKCIVVDGKMHTAASNARRTATYIRADYLRRTYGITLAQYTQMLIFQKYRCAICDIHQNALNRNLDIDHCHKTGRVRGLLCFGCNVGLGKFKDDEKLLLKAVRYLGASRTVQAQSVAEREAASEIAPGNRDRKSSVRRGSRREDLSPFT